ncbi:MAG: hypothetical protein IJU44_04425 [Kiritimatiellae bacterium]|nr:hypothetical protein [Kiritimatiellia bacterium]
MRLVSTGNGKINRSDKKAVFRFTRSWSVPRTLSPISNAPVRIAEMSATPAANARKALR